MLLPLGAEIKQFLEQEPGQWVAEFKQLAQGLSELERVSKDVLTGFQSDENLVNSVAVDYLNLLGYVAYGYLWLRMAKVAEAKPELGSFSTSKVKTAKFYFAKLFPRVHSLVATIDAGSASLYEFDQSEF